MTKISTIEKWGMGTALAYECQPLPHLFFILVVHFRTESDRARGGVCLDWSPVSDSVVQFKLEVRKLKFRNKEFKIKTQNEQE